MSILSEFREFAVKGNAVDLAVGIVVGAAFTKIVTSIVNDLIMPPIGLLLGGTDFDNLKFVMKHGFVDAAGKTIPEVAIRYGAFINIVIEFLIVAFAVFMVVKAINTLRAHGEKMLARQKAADDAQPPANPTP